MKPINQITIDGRIISDVRLGETSQKQTPVMNLKLVHNEPGRKVPVYIDVEVWGRVAESLASTLEKGSFVIVHGKLQRDKWTGPDSSPRSKLKITANKIVIDHSVNVQHASTSF